MSKFVVVKKQYELNNTDIQQILVSKQVTEISDNGTSNFSVLKKYSEITTTVTFDSCGGSSVDNISFVAGKTYGELPIPTKSQHIFLGWFTQQTGGTKITSDSVVSVDITKLYAQWELVNIDSSNCTSYEVKTTSSYKNTGIYTASIKSSSTPIYIDWGDGSVEKLTSSISQKSHTYSSVGTFIVKISNNITSFAPSYNNSTWYGTTSQNRYTFNRMISTGSNINSLPSYAFYYCQKMTNIDFMEACFTNVTSLPSYCFYYCSGLTSIQGAKRFTSLGSYSLQYSIGLCRRQNISDCRFTSLTNTYVFANCTNVTEWIFPEAFTGTTLGNYTFSNNTKLTNVGQLSSTIIVPLNTLTAIPSYGFQNCTSLKNALITKNVKAINSYAFYGCTALSSIDYQATDLTSIGNYAFYNCTSNRNIQVPDSVKSIGSYAFYQNYNTNASSLNLPNGLTSLGTYAYQNCYNLKNLSIPSSLTSIGDYAFAGCRNLSNISDYRLTAQTVGANTFGNTTGTGTNAYTGYSTRGNNILSTYFAATGYDENVWNDPLQNPDKCGFVQQYIDPENVVSCTVTFDAGIGSVSEATRTILKGKKIGALPIPTVTGEEAYFGGWSPVAADVDSIIDEDYKVTSDMTLYAVYSSQPFANYEVILNNQWQASSKANPDTTKYDGVYESFSNYNQSNKAAVMYIKIKGYSKFTIYIRSYSESIFDYTVAFNLDAYTPSKPLTSNPSSSTSGVKAHTSGKQNSGTTIGSYTKVEYTGIDNKEHYICVAYRKDGSFNSGDDRGYVLVEKQGGGTFEPIKSITVNFEVGEGTLVSGETTTIDVQGSTLSRIPEISAPASKPYFIGWNTQADGSGEYYDNTTILPNQESLTLYAYYVAEDPIDPNKDIYLCFTAEEANSTISMSAVGSAPTVYLETSPTTLERSWSDFIVGSTTITLANVGDKVYFRAKQDNNVFASSAQNYNKFVMTGKIAASGNLNTLLKADGSVIDLTGRNYCYLRIFTNCTSLTQAPTLPATTLADRCYYYMFEGCTALTQAPALPATTLASYCYYFMFENCSTLTQAPELPATTLAADCYSGMFRGCKSLTQAPALPATTLAADCYYLMFQNCTSLTQAPELPATTLANNCYNSMFSGCTSLTQAPELPATTLAINCYNSMFYGCTSLTQAPELPATTLTTNCYQYMFRGCTALTQAPELPATTLTTSCYQYMFYGCTNLNSINVNFSTWNPSNATPNWVTNVSSSGTFTCPEELPETYGTAYIPTGWTVVHPEPEVPEVPEVPVVDYLCFTAEQANSTVTMTAYGSAPTVYLETSRTGEDGSWSDFTVDSTTITLVNAGDKVYFRAKQDNNVFATSDSDYNYFGMTGKIAASGNLNTLLKADGSVLDLSGRDGCYNYMFENCSTLTQAPELPATTLAEYCYACIFYGCISLTKAFFPNLEKETVATEVVENQMAFYYAANNIETICKDGILIIN